MVEITPAPLGDVLDRFRAGDEAAFLEIYRGAQSEIRLWVSQFFDKWFDREEALQETWLTIHRMRGVYVPSKGPLRPWLKALTINRCKELLRARGRRPNPESELDETIECGQCGPDEHVLVMRIREAICRFAASLAADERRTFFALLNESSHQETADLLEVSVRRCKYLRMKIFGRAINDPQLRNASLDLLGCN